MNNPQHSEQDQYWMGKALELARCAGDLDEVPVGAILVMDGEIIGEGYNQPISAQDPSAHAEIMAIRAAARHLSNYRLPGSQIYSTMEPCPMCAGAIVHARIRRLVYAARDEKWGACGSLFNIPGCEGLNHKLQVQGGVMAEESAQLLRSFFKLRRG